MQFSNWNSEPIEVLVLKHQLANLQCKCLNCKRYNKQLKKNVYNAGVQANQRHGSADRFSQATSDQNIEKPIKVDKASSSNRLINTGDEICPSCRIIAKFLSENQNKVLKDEESETYAITCCDKSTDKSVEYLEKSTSTTIKCQSCSMLKALSNEFDDSKNGKKRNHERVSFEDSLEKSVDSEEEMTGHCEQEVSIFGGGLSKTKSMYGYCVCLEKFMNAISPPLT